MTSKELALLTPKAGPQAKIGRAILDFVGNVPGTLEHKSSTPDTDARNLTTAAAKRAALAAGALALPPGPLGWLTILPEMLAVWKIQAQVVSDIAALYGQDAALTKEQMLYCLFRHTAAQAVRDVVVRVGDRILVRSVSARALQTMAQMVGVKLTQRSIGKGLSRLLPVVGAVGVGAYAYYDTTQVAKTAIGLFARVIDVENEPGLRAKTKHAQPG
jgi:uncharacterized protein (DUF697 family)